ncbi:hypothetical protein A2634_05095 [Candidatus Amesbacteria bacterium RIFCSPHIGHO2_01_FULL_48_32]|uniref:dTDP-4-dehydrorhamnose reductase n=1 Tax=Candidatus Amesbacteria bacterium RIFCSPLOWO2_01_FULL_48_25 TaxID=1797259 RepID=A0A1F4ZEZ9_9BACT|nr:MAG: hypothetical protein A2634_05095 [Candidatus Amesbacteria bacterium RIFCSPHIGHO2_01_FULL_48_32]OGD04044.1 MAG: hypothetical protein A2989_01440 [Candidatus Amesbacteria bacterium RIFCSPLOWO2_01_FULL_48_25]HJZ05692.1 sugar nucleotide-binding protein [Patescibacteria group bacterium]
MNGEKILVTGATGLVGSDFIGRYGSKYHVSAPLPNELDIASEPSVRNYFAAHTFTDVVNFAAYTSVSKAQEEAQRCLKVNVGGVENILKHLPSHTHFIQISTEMVFPGTADDRGPYAENHPLPDPDRLTLVYSQSKNLAERLLDPQNQRHAIVRINSPVGPKRFPPKPDYLHGPLERYIVGNLYPLFIDQWLSLSLIPDVSESLIKIINEGLTGIFHISATNTGTAYNIITRFLQKLGHDTSQIKTTSVDPNRYLQYGGLNPIRTQEKLGMSYGTWQDIEDRLIKDGFTA